MASQASATDVSPQPLEGRIPPASYGDASSSKPNEDREIKGPEPMDPLAGMAPADKYGLKGLNALMHTYPDFNALTIGIDPNTLGLDLNSAE